MRTPTTTPRSKSLSGCIPAVCQPTRMLFHRREKRETEPAGGLRLGRDDEAPARLIALAVRGDVATPAQVLVHEAPFRRRHRPHRDLAALAADAIRHAVGLDAERLLALAAVAGGINDHAQAPGAAQHDALGQMLHRLDDRTVRPDERLRPGTLDRPAQHPVKLRKHDFRVRSEGLHQRLQQLAQLLLGSELVGLVAHRRRPDRFLRGLALGGNADRLFVIRIEPEAARVVIRQENSRSFFWMSGLVNLLETYRNSREQYPTFDSFLPRVTEYFNGVAPRMHELTDRLQPKVVSTSILDGASGVDPGVKTIVVRFSMPMNKAGPFKDSKLNGGRFDQAGTVLPMPVTLEPARDYAFPLRWLGGQSFVSADGVPLAAVLLRFHTGAASSPKQR